MNETILKNEWIRVTVNETGNQLLLLKYTVCGVKGLDDNVTEIKYKLDTEQHSIVVNETVENIQSQY